MTYIILGILVLIVIYFILTYNTLVGNKNKVSNAWGQIEVQLKRRFDLIPNLVETVKGYAAHEKNTFEQVITARTKYMSSQSPEEMIAANGQMTQALGKLFALSESYPELKANNNFIQLSDELSKTEDKIGFSRQFYNDTVMMYNNTVKMFPGNIAAGIFNFKEEPFFKIDEAERTAPKVNFS